MNLTSVQELDKLSEELTNKLNEPACDVSSQGQKIRKYTV